jgi:hypothetical protein
MLQDSSMLDIAKFVICFANILMTEAAKPQGLINFSEGGGGGSKMKCKISFMKEM